MFPEILVLQSYFSKSVIVEIGSVNLPEFPSSLYFIIWNCSGATGEDRTVPNQGLLSLWVRIYGNEMGKQLGPPGSLQTNRVAELPEANDRRRRRLQWPNPDPHINRTSALFTIADLIAKYEMKANAARGDRGAGRDKESFTRADYLWNTSLTARRRRRHNVACIHSLPCQGRPLIW